MAPSQKRKRKPIPKRPCPCCGSLLSEKTIERHASGTHVPTRITVTLASQKQANLKVPLPCDGDILGDLSSDWGGSDSVVADDLHVIAGELHAEDGRLAADDGDEGLAAEDGGLAAEDDTAGGDDAAGGGLGVEEILRNTWRTRVGEFDSDVEDEDFEEKNTSDLESETDSDWEGRDPGICNGLGMDDLVDEDLQRILAEFSASFFYP
jgi:hypothetical protein